MLKFDAVIPQTDANGNFINMDSLQSSMEIIANDNQTHNMGQDTIYKSGTYMGQSIVYSWFIADTNLSTAITNYTNFINGITFSVSPYYHSWTVN